MCGLAGFLAAPRRFDEPEQRARVDAMAMTLVHRGPDAGGVWTDAAAGIALGHRRLSIIDLSAAGAQPMRSASGRCVIAYNGEVYNFAELRTELEREGFGFAGHSDTEVVLAACEHWGVEAAVQRFVGMFAFALWDRERRVLTLARDRLGIKPVYWGRAAGAWLFGSELKALRAFAGWTPEVDRDVLAAYLRYNYVPAPHCIYRGMHKLAPGTLVELHADGTEEQRVYWSLDAIAAAPPSIRDPREAEARLAECLGDAVRSRMIADVPLGALLSGGIDSSIVVALMQQLGTRPARTFSIGFEEHGYDEAVHARAVARHLGTEHVEQYVTAREAREVIPELATFYDEPFADASQVPTLLVSRLARTAVTVSLSGDGGDELFAGYNRYLWGQRIQRLFGPLPVPMTRAIAAALRALSPAQWRALASLIPAARRPRLLADKVEKVADVLAAGAAGGKDFYQALVSFWLEPSRLVAGCEEPAMRSAAGVGTRAGFVERMQLIDALTYLPDDILTKVDRASMAVSLEVRVPLLDHRVVECAWQLAPEFKLRGREGKWLLRRMLYRHVPRELVDRPKMGFGIPIDDWLRGPLREWAEDLLAEDSLRAGGMLEPAPIRKRWHEHLARTRNWQYSLWGVLMFQAWRARWMS